MEQPLEYIDSHFFTHVCLLNKALYGLKQAPRVFQLIFSHTSFFFFFFFFFLQSR